MGISHYEIYYQGGLKKGVTMEQAIQGLQKLLKISLPKAEKMILANNRVIKSGLSKDQAEKYFTALDKIGMLIEVREVTDSISNIIISEVKADSPVENNSAPVNYDRAKPDNQRILQLQFNGKGFEYFKIWIVNIFLTIVTLGIYSAWAKVRNK